MWFLNKFFFINNCVNIDFVGVCIDKKVVWKSVDFLFREDLLMNWLIKIYKVLWIDIELLIYV